MYFFYYITISEIKIQCIKHVQENTIYAFIPNKKARRSPIKKEKTVVEENKRLTSEENTHKIFFELDRPTENRKQTSIYMYLAHYKMKGIII